MRSLEPPALDSMATSSNAQLRESLRGRIRIALWLAIDYNPARALDMLGEIRPAVNRRDREIGWTGSAPS